MHVTSLFLQQKVQQHVMKTYLNDTTLRDGEQAPGVAFTEIQKIEITQQLLEIGVHDIEVGTAAILPREPLFLKYLQDSDQNSRFSTWCRAKTEDVETALSSKAKKIHISFPVSDFQLYHMNLSRRWVIKQAQVCIRLAKSHADYVSVGAQDATRCDPSFLLEFISLLNSENTDRLRFSDTVGIARPSQIAKMSTLLRSHFKGHLEFHGHNDLGMAVANCISAVENGTDQISTTINGIGERAGNAALEQVAAAIQFGLKQEGCVDLTKLFPLCTVVAGASNTPIPKNSPVIGESVFTHESGIHCHGQNQHPLMYQPFLPERIGRTSKIVLGKHTGSTTLCAALRKKGIVISRERARSLLTQIYTNPTERASAIDVADILPLLAQ